MVFFTFRRCWCHLSTSQHGSYSQFIFHDGTLISMEGNTINVHITHLENRSSQNPRNGEGETQFSEENLDMHVCWTLEGDTLGVRVDTSAKVEENNTCSPPLSDYYYYLQTLCKIYGFLGISITFYNLCCPLRTLINFMHIVF